MVWFGMELNEARDYIRKDVSRWFEQNTKAMGMQVLSQRYGKCCRKHGIRVSDFILDDRELIVKEADNGGRWVVPKELFLVTFPDVGSQIDFWKNYKVLMF